MTGVDMFERISRQVMQARVVTGTGTVQNNTRAEQSEGFGELLKQELQRSNGRTTTGVAFSKHAISRAAERGIQVNEHLMDRLASSVEKAQAKGATNILAMDSDRAFIINVPSAKVITAITQDEMKENVFTNIDGAVFL